METHDLKHISCGLVPAMNSILQRSGEQVVMFHIKQGIRLEIISSFGTDAHWELQYENHIGMDIARFTRRKAGSSKKELNIIEY